MVVPSEVSLCIAKGNIGDVSRQNPVLLPQLLERSLVPPQLVDDGTHYGM
jgi:hypothetical protein